jgi:hypothetical protein
VCGCVCVYVCVYVYVCVLEHLCMCACASMCVADLSDIFLVRLIRVVGEEVHSVAMPIS